MKQRFIAATIRILLFLLIISHSLYILRTSSGVTTKAASVVGIGILMIAFPILYSAILLVQNKLKGMAWKDATVKSKLFLGRYFHALLFTPLKDILKK